MSTAVLLSSWESSFFPSLQKIVYHKLMFKFVKYFSVVINIIMIFFLGLLMWFFSNIKAAFHTWNKFPFSSVQFISVHSCPTVCNPMNRSTPGLPVHQQLLEFTQTHVYRVGDVIQPSHPLSSPSPPAPNPSQHQSLFQWVNPLHEVARVLEFQL